MNIHLKIIHARIAHWILFVFFTNSNILTIQHENYNGNGAGFPNDIALLKVRTPINLNSKAVAIDLATMGMDFVGNNNCWITGWGLTQGKCLLSGPVLSDLVRLHWQYSGPS